LRFREDEDQKMIADGSEDEEKWLAAGAAAFKQNAFYMQRAIVNSAFPFTSSFRFSVTIFVEIEKFPNLYFSLMCRIEGTLILVLGKNLSCFWLIRTRII